MPVYTPAVAQEGSSGMQATKKKLSKSKTPPNHTPSRGGISKNSSAMQFVRAKRLLTSFGLPTWVSPSDVRYDEVVISRLIARSELLDGCFVLPRSINHNGYAQLRYRGKTQMVHRVTYEIFVGPIPPGQHIDHVQPQCKHRNCWRPSHLEAVTQTMNNYRTRRDVCTEGHALTPANTVVEKGGARRCLICRRNWFLAKHGWNYRGRGKG